MARFSSLLMGSVTFERLYAYGLAEISDAAYVPTLDRLFRTPACGYASPIWHAPVSPIHLRLPCVPPVYVYDTMGPLW